MGKGDKRTRRGKIFAGTFGKTRLKKKRTSAPPPAADAKPAKRTKKQA